MKKSFKKILAISLTALLLLTACSSSNNAAPQSPGDYESDSNFNAGDSSPSIDSPTSSPEPGATESQLPDQAVDTGRKLIRKINLTIHTENFNTFSDMLNSKVYTLGGYVETLEISTDRNDLRQLYMVARVPKDKMNIFTETAATHGTVTNRSESAQDVTLDYVDSESHLKVLTIEQERILEILSKAETLQDIFTLESRLTEIRYQIESYESRLRTYDNLVDYGTITVNAYETADESEIIKEEKPVMVRISTGFSNSIQNIGSFFTELFVALAVNLPYILIIVMLAAAVLIVFRVRSKRQKPEHGKEDKIIPPDDDIDNI